MRRSESPAGSAALLSRLSLIRSLIVVFPYAALALLFLTRPYSCRERQPVPGGQDPSVEAGDAASVGGLAGAADLPTPWAPGMPNPLQNWLLTHERGPVGDRWHEILDTFHQHLHRFQGAHATVVEFGVGSGASLAMWRQYFGPRALIFGVSGDTRYWQLEPHLSNVTLVVGNQSDRAFLRRLVDTTGPVDVLIDSGGGSGDGWPGRSADQVAVFEELYEAVAPLGGVYVGEGLHASYWQELPPAGDTAPPTFVDVLKGLIDQVNGFHAHSYWELFGRAFRHDVPAPHAGGFVRSTDSVHFYDNMVVIEKRPRTAPASVTKGDLAL